MVVEDACHALGAMDFDGCSKVGSCAHSLATCFSFHPVKPITTGEGGAITTNDADMALRLRLLRSHGRDENGEMIVFGYNYRMTEMQAALGRSQLERCDEMRERRLALVPAYNALPARPRYGLPTFMGCASRASSMTQRANLCFLDCIESLPRCASSCTLCGFQQT